MVELRTTSCYLILARDGRATWRGPRIVGMTKTKPALKRGQVAVKINLHIPSALFEEFIPQVEATIGEPDLIVPAIELEPEVG